MKKCKDCKSPAAPDRGRCEYHLSVYRKYARDNMDSVRSNSMMRKYGIDLEQYNIMLEEQDGVCAICGNPETAISRWGTPLSLAVDHCHETGRVRGLLCRNCNVTLGRAGDNVELLRSMADYLEVY